MALLIVSAISFILSIIIEICFIKWGKTDPDFYAMSWSFGPMFIGVSAFTLVFALFNFFS